VAAAATSCCRRRHPLQRPSTTPECRRHPFPPSGIEDSILVSATARECRAKSRGETPNYDLAKEASREREEGRRGTKRERERERERKGWHKKENIVGVKFQIFRETCSRLIGLLPAHTSGQGTSIVPSCCFAGRELQIVVGLSIFVAQWHSALVVSPSSVNRGINVIDNKQPTR